MNRLEAKTAIVFSEVTFLGDYEVQDFVIIGIGSSESNLQTSSIIGEYAKIRSHTVIYYGNQIGKNFQTGHGVMIRELNEIGDSVSIGSHSTIEHHIQIGSRTRIHSNVFIPEFSKIFDDVWIGPNVVLTNAIYPANPQTKQNLKGVTLHSFSRIGANSTILPGIEIGRNSLIGAGSVVTKDVPEGKVVVGNPAKVIKDISDISEYDFVRLLAK